MYMRAVEILKILILRNELTYRIKFQKQNGTEISNEPENHRNTMPYWFILNFYKLCNIYVLFSKELFILLHTYS